MNSLAGGNMRTQLLSHANGGKRVADESNRDLWRYKGSGHFRHWVGLDESACHESIANSFEPAMAEFLVGFQMSSFRPLVPGIDKQ
jgi:hypothetical protein